MEATVLKAISSDGTPIAYWQSGSGAPLLLVHGSTADHTRWRPVLPYLEPQFTVYAMDRRGRGASGDSNAYSLELEYDDVVAVCNTLPRPVNLIGHSYGALCALEAALRTTNIGRLVLYEPPIPGDKPLYPRALRERLEALSAQGDREDLLVTFFREVVRIPDPELEALRADPSWEGRIAAAHTTIREFADEDYVFDPERFRDMRTPTLLLTGGDSPPFFGEAINKVASALPNSKVTVMEGQQHIAITTAPALFAREVLSFLQS